MVGREKTKDKGGKMKCYAPDCKFKKRLVFGIMCLVIGIFLSVVVFKVGYEVGKSKGFEEGFYLAE